MLRASPFLARSLLAALFPFISLLSDDISFTVISRRYMKMLSLVELKGDTFPRAKELRRFSAADFSRLIDFTGTLDLFTF